MNGEDLFPKINVAIIGPASVGKSSIVVRYVYNTFSTEYIPTLQDHYTKTERVEDDVFKLNILDTSGTEDFVSVMVSEWMENKDGLILAYSVESPGFLKSLEAFVQKITYYDSENEIPKILIANKIDIKDREISEEDGEQFAKKMGAEYVEVSAKNDYNVNEAFMILLKKIRNKRKIIK
mmetsp:Transcript_41568/g.36936  ORF Transcript_41568/g.36936 Transcript_41568/m.36936 type:complete len:179 (-) Transcript_41568:394-930(-)|eukprot:CAMPEP_0114583596 /NCGR_PEP_ID=MMETSP0125-20121206/7283_1 /TAXON_ID=485358 ORGANISM="Aristerostoma sp., Strain ATCC 50986" /NCGR_SAMPLE_ID=MMETSP0125 /ASSEMBLY_ACC=CAM_ASM_000245 /LENGTH=178 /DNA_ID=CAMNT_0001777119 /DNA_START=311 /DNA_END=847 /DNA_ORIENTATION=+